MKKQKEGCCAFIQTWINIVIGILIMIDLIVLIRKSLSINAKTWNLWKEWKKFTRAVLFIVKAIKEKDIPVHSKNQLLNHVLVFNSYNFVFIQCICCCKLLEFKDLIPARSNFVIIKSLLSEIKNIHKNSQPFQLRSVIRKWWQYCIGLHSFYPL